MLKVFQTATIHHHPSPVFPNWHSCGGCVCSLVSWSPGSLFLVAAIIAGCKPEIPKMTGLDENKVLKESLKCWENPPANMDRIQVLEVKI